MGVSVLQLHRGPVYPPSNGEEVRIWKTAEKFSEIGDVWLVHPSGSDHEMQSDVHAINVDNVFLKHKLTRIYLWNALLGYSEDNLIDRLQSWSTVRAVRRLDRDTTVDIVCCESPQMLRASRYLARRYDAALLLNKHNAMFDLLEQQLRSRPIPAPIRRRAVSNLYSFEQQGIADADGVVFQSESDRRQFTCSADTVTEVIPNGADYEAISQGGDHERLRRQLGIHDGATICLFIGACDYEPNRAAAKLIDHRLAPSLPDTEFLIVGRNPPNVSRENVYTPGFVEDLPGALELADIALCPLAMGSGTKLKMMDYLAAGLPIVTTSVGAEGIALEDRKTALIRDTIPEIKNAIVELQQSAPLAATLSENSKSLGKRHSWVELLSSYEHVAQQLLQR